MIVSNVQKPLENKKKTLGLSPCYIGRNERTILKKSQCKMDIVNVIYCRDLVAILEHVYY